MEDKSKRTYKKKEKKQETKIVEAPVIVQEPKIIEKPKEHKIGFGFWFTTAIKSGKVQFWQDKEIFIFFKNRGLTDKETKLRYDEMLKLY